MHISYNPDSYVAEPAKQIVVGIWMSPGSARYKKFKRVTLSTKSE